MRAALATTVLAAAVIATSFGTLAQSAIAGPTRHQIARAIARAERSRSLWATINICSARGYHDDLGVRGQMPALGFPASLSMVVEVNYWSEARHRFVAGGSSNGRRTLALGRAASGLQQAGEVFGPFKAHTGLLNATIRFVWTRAGNVLGQTRRATSAGHRDADFGRPPRFSAAQCRIR